MRLLVDLEPHAAARGLACDEALLESMRAGGEDAVRLWVSERSIVIGRSQSVAAECDRGAATRLGIPVVRRVSGGGAVYHYPGNLNVSIVLANSRPLGTVDEAFLRLGDSFARGLEDGLGVKAARQGRGLYLRGRKISGAAQARRGNAVLLHATLLVWPDHVPMASVLRALHPGYAPERTASRGEPTTTLAEELGRRVLLDEAADAVLRGMAGLLPGRWMPGAMTEAEAAAAARLRATRYEDRGWNESI